MRHFLYEWVFATARPQQFLERFSTFFHVAGQVRILLRVTFFAAVRLGGLTEKLVVPGLSWVIGGGPFGSLTFIIAFERRQLFLLTAIGPERRPLQNPIDGWPPDKFFGSKEDPVLSPLQHLLDALVLDRRVGRRAGREDDNAIQRTLRRERLHRLEGVLLQLPQAIRPAHPRLQVSRDLTVPWGRKLNGARAAAAALLGVADQQAAQGQGGRTKIKLTTRTPEGHMPPRI